MKNSFAASLLLLLVATGLAFAAFVGDSSASVELMNILFLGFAGAIIAVQLLPSYLLLMRILQGLLQPGSKAMKRHSS